MEAALGEDRERDVEQLTAAPGGREARSGETIGHMGQKGTQGRDIEHSAQESPTIMANSRPMRPAKQVPASTTRRPAEPFRPLPARKLGVSLLASQARRRRYRGTLPPRAGAAGW